MIYLRFLLPVAFLLLYLPIPGFSQSGWEIQQTPSNITLCSVIFVNNQIGFSIGNDYGSGHYIFIKTTNGGLNWFTIKSESGSSKCPFGLCFTNDLTGYVVGGDVWLSSQSFVFKTTNGGINWNLTNFPDSTVYRGISFPNSNTGYISGSLGYIMKTTNAGTNWFYLNSGTQSGLPGIYFVDALTGFTVGANGTIMRTINGGLTWESQISNTDIPLRNVQFKNSNTGYITGYNTNTSESILLKTTNSGNNWIILMTGNYTSFNFMSPFFTNTNIGYIACNNGIIKTTNGGNNWTLLELPIASIVIPWYGNPIFFLNDSTGYVSTSNNSSSIILKTTSGGISDFPTPPSQLYGYYYKNPRRIQLSWRDNSNIETGYKIERSYNSDTSWFLYDSVNANISSYIDYNINPGYCIYHYRVYAVKGINHSAFSNTIAVIVTNIIRSNDVIPAEFSLYQNYPNPFNPSTAIKFGMPKSSAVRLCVYDITGKEIETLVNEMLNAGLYEIKWDGSKYASGVYFIRIDAGVFSDTKRMVLTK